MKRDYYEVLGLQKGATADEIKKAYRKLAMKWHPDKWTQASEAEQKEAERQFKDVGEAYAVLSDPEKRARYDQFGHAGMGGSSSSSTGGSTGGFDFGGQGFDPFDLFNEIFGRSTGGRRRTTYTYTTRGGGNPFSGFGQGFDPFGAAEEQEVRGEDVRVTLRLTLEEIAQGVTKQVTVRHSVAQVDGTVRQVEETIPIILPAGVMEGQKFKAARKGNAAPYGRGVSGDLVVNIEEIPHAQLLRDHQDLVYNCLLPFPTAALGGPVEIPTLNGRARINIPQGTQPGKMLRLKGKGLPDREHGGVGDLIINLLVYVPETLNASERAAVEQLAAGAHCQPTEQQRQSLFARLKYFFTSHNNA